MSNQRQLRHGLGRVAFLLGLVHCAHTSPPPPPEATTKALYEQGRTALGQKRYTQALTLFQKAQGNLLSTWSTEAWLGEADTLFAREEWDHALQAYDNFISWHPHHKQVVNGYCLYKRILSEFNNLSGRLPPKREKDQGELITLHQGLLSFPQKHPNSPYLGEVKKVRSLVEYQLADHELYVVDFYEHQQEHQAALWRLLYLLENYQKTSFEPQVLDRIARLALRTQQTALAQRAYCLLTDGYAQDPLAAQARRWLQVQHALCQEVSPLRTPQE